MTGALLSFLAIDFAGAGAATAQLAHRARPVDPRSGRWLARIALSLVTAGAGFLVLSKVA